MGTNALPSVQALVQCLGDSNHEVVATAISALGQVQPNQKAVFDPIARFLDSPEPMLRSCALRPLASFGALALRATIHALNHTSHSPRPTAPPLLPHPPPPPPPTPPLPPPP